MTPWWTQTIRQVAETLQSNESTGISPEEAQRRLAANGPNQLQEQEGTGPLALFIEQFKDFIIWVLIGAAVVSGFLGEWIDAAAIIAIVLLNAALGFFQEFRAEKSLAALKKLSSPNSKVIRSGDPTLVPSSALVTGDLVELEAGDNIPADSRMVWHTANFSVQEASLTGESAPVMKSIGALEREDTSLGDRNNMVFMGTSVTAGKARALVAETGMNTELGKIAGLLQTSGKEATPLQKRLEQFGKWLVYLCGVLVAIVFILGLWRGIQQQGSLTSELLVRMFLTAVSLAVAAIPEGLPAVVTIALALGLQRMVKRNALIRKLPSVETLGGASVICSDKTGTLTRNEMTVQEICAGGRLYTVTGTGYAPSGKILQEGKESTAANDPDLAQCLLGGVLCSGAILAEREGVWTILGDPTEGALLTAAAKAGIKRSEAEQEYIFVEEIPFDSERRMMTIVRKKGSEYIAFTKGAPDVLLKFCTSIRENGVVRPITDEDVEKMLEINDNFAEKALRVLGMAYRRFDEQPPSYHASDIEMDLVFAGCQAMMDPPREEVKRAIAECKTAGIRTIMITGDHKNTAVAIAKSLDFFEENSLALTGEELDKLDDREFDQVIEKVPVYARVSPENKLRIVRHWRKRNQVVAMTGDGVNDAPAVKEADIGIAMGITGTDVTKEVSDMVITDDNFASIVAAVEEGRGIYDNIQKFIHYLLSCNAGEILVMFISSLIGMPVPLLPVQILWVNLVTDGLPALALGVDPVDKNIMRRKPRKLGDRVITPGRVRLMLFQGLVIALCSLAAFTFIYYLEDRRTLGEVFSALFSFDLAKLKEIFTVPEAMREVLIGKARTVGFIVLAFCQDFHSYNCRNQTQSLFKIGFFTNKKLIGATMVSMTLNAMAIYNPFFQEILKTQPLSGLELLVVVISASMPFWVMELYKLIRRSAARSATAA